MGSCAAVTAQLDALVAQLVGEGVLDNQFDQLRELQDDSNPDFVEEVCILYFQDSAGKIERIGQMLETLTPDYNELDTLVHQFKGSSASLGAQTIAQLCVKLREQCQAHNRAGCIQLQQQILAAYQELQAKLQMFITLETQRKQLVSAGMG